MFIGGVRRLLKYLPRRSKEGRTELKIVMPDRVFKPETEKDDMPSASPEEFLQAIGEGGSLSACPD